MGLCSTLSFKFYFSNSVSSESFKTKRNQNTDRPAFITEFDKYLSWNSFGLQGAENLAELT